MSANLRDTCIKLYMRNCRALHNVAYFEWRENFSSNVTSLIDKYSNKLSKCLSADQKHFDAEDEKNMNNALYGSYDESPTHNDTEAVVEIDESVAGITQNLNASPKKMKKTNSILDLMIIKVQDENSSVNKREIDDLNMIGIRASKPAQKQKNKIAKRKQLKSKSNLFEILTYNFRY
jgi:hypothetical protein